jgi:hypothetical protein
MASYQVAETGKAVLVVYDVPVRVVGERGLHPRGFQTSLRRLLDTGKIRRVQGSTLIVEDPALLEPLINLIISYNGSIILVEGAFSCILPREKG